MNEGLSVALRTGSQISMYMSVCTSTCRTCMYLGNDDGDGWLRCHKSAGHFSETAKGRPAHDYLSSQPSPMTAEK